MVAPDASGRLSVGLVGGGRGGAALLDLILGYPRAQLLVVVDPDPRAPALGKARSFGIPTAVHHLDVFTYPVRLVLEVTGRPEVLDDLLRAKPAAVEVIGAGSLRFFWDLLQDYTLTRSRLLEETERRRRETETLADIGRSISQSLDLDTVLQRVTEAAKDLTGSGVSLIALREVGSEAFAFRYMTGARTQRYHELRVEPGRGSGGQVLLTGRPFRTENYVEDPRISPDFVATAREEGIVAGLVVPIRSEGRIEGLLYAHDRVARRYTDRDEALLLQLADHAAVVIGNARLYQAAHDRARELHALHDVATRLTATLDLPQVLDAVGDGALALSGAQRCVIFELDPHDQCLHPRASRGLAAEAAVPAMPLGLGVVGSAALRREPVFSPDLERQPPPGYEELWQDSSMTLGDRVRRQGWRALLAAPLVSKDTVFGSMLLLWDRVHHVSDGELRLVAGLAQQAAVAIENARLYAEARRALADLTEAQERLVRGETLRALGELASGAAHHLNNLLAVVVGRVQLLRMKADSDPVRRALGIIERAALDGADVVRRIQTFARVRLVEGLASVDLNRVVSDVVELTRGRWQDAMVARGHQLQVALELSDIPDVRGNEAELREAVTNLLINAIEACPMGGRISLATRTDGRGVVLVIADTGVGMPEDVVRKALEPFFTTKGLKSTGLGLSVTHGIVRRHGGDLTIDSRPGEGTTVTVRLPVAPETSEEPPSSASPPPIRALLVLVVDDEPQVREVVADLLAADGHLAWQAPAGADALAILEGGTVPDLVLTDLGMPGMTGWKVAGAIKARWPAVSVGLMTGWGDAVEATPAERAAVDFILPKPVTRDALRAALSAR